MALQSTGGSTAVDFWRSQTSNSLPDGVTDTSDAISRVGNVGIGVAGGINPLAKLDVNGSGLIVRNTASPSTPIALIEFVSGRSNGGAAAGGTSDIAFQFGTGGFRHWIETRHANAAGSGNQFRIYLNTGSSLNDSSAPGTNNVQALLLSGENGGSGVFGAGVATAGMVLTVNGDAAKVGGGDWAAVSDERIKMVLGQYRRGLEEIRSLRPVYYQYVGTAGMPDDRQAEKQRVGLIAQAVEAIVPEMVTRHNAHGFEDFRTLDTSDLIYMLINAVKDLARRLEAVE